MCTAYTGYHGTSEIQHGLCACTVDNLFAKARGLSLRTGAQTMLHVYFSLDNPMGEIICSCFSALERTFKDFDYTVTINKKCLLSRPQATVIVYQASWVCFKGKLL